MQEKCEYFFVIIVVCLSYDLTNQSEVRDMRIPIHFKYGAKLRFIAVLSAVLQTIERSIIQSIKAVRSSARNKEETIHGLIAS